MFGYEFAESRIDSERRRADAGLTVTFALAAVVPAAIALASEPAFAAGALAGLLAGTVARR